MQALILAAGCGKRLGKYTNDNTKCMMEVSDVKLIDRSISAIRETGINRLVMVVGYKKDNLVNYLKSKYENSGFEIVFIDNDVFETTNNIWSFYLAKEYMCQDDTLLLESDLIFEPSLLKSIIDADSPNLAVVAKHKDWMDGTVVTCDDAWNITELFDKKELDPTKMDSYFKTVNIYKFSKEFLRDTYIPRIEQYMMKVGKGSYYETPLKEIISEHFGILHAYELGDLVWYEIDTEEDLRIATDLFS